MTAPILSHTLSKTSPRNYNCKTNTLIFGHIHLPADLTAQSDSPWSLEAVQQSRTVSVTFSLDITQMDRLHDIEGELSLLPTAQGGRKTPVWSGYRPTHRLYRNYLTSGTHEYPDSDQISPGETTRALVWFTTPKVYPASVWVGRVLAVCEGEHPIGLLTVTKVLNSTLIASPETYSPLWVEPPDLRKKE